MRHAWCAGVPWMQVVAVHGDMDEAVPLEHDEAYRLIVCLRRKAA